MNQKDTIPNLPISNTIQSVLEVSFATHKKRIAIIDGLKHYTYQQIDEASTQVSQWLIAQKKDNGSHIALCLQDRFQLIIWILGILKARSVFIPLDYHHPEGRIQQLLDISDTKLLITDRLGKERLPITTNNLEVLALEDIQLSEKSKVETTKTTTPLGEDKIYIYFTSGSTGVPKAILGKNESLHHFVNWQVTTFGLNTETKSSQFVSPGFDAFLRDVFPALSVGGTICIPDFEIENSTQLLHWIAATQISLIHCVPSFFKLLLSEELETVSLAKLKHILLSGEKLNIQDLNKWYKIVGDKVQLVNLYGATETTMIKTYYLVQPSDVENTSISIGKPISGTQVFLLDEELRPVGKNNVGEIYIRTKYGTHGYYKNEGLTAERFIVNPYGTESTDVLYKSGDLGRFNSSGNLEFLGRIDRQIKIRGIRIEPGEIEQHLVQHDSVKEAIIKPFETKGKDTFLCAYIIAKKKVSDTDIKAYLSTQLPAYLIPDYITFLEVYPLLPNGKIDVKSLPNPKSFVKGKIILPQNPEQEKMRTLWAEILEVETAELSIDAHFIEVGGHSLKMVFLVNKIKKEFGVTVSLKELLAYDTIECLSNYIATQEKTAHTPINAVAKARYYPLSPSQQRMYFLYEFDRESTVYNMKQVVSFHGLLDTQKIKNAFGLLVKRHESLRTTFDMVEDQVMQQIHEEVDVTIHYLENNAPIASIIANFSTPFDLSKGPLFRIGVISTKEDEHILIIDNHHIISDIVSSEILLKDFIKLYAGNQLEALQIHYKDYAAWLKENQEATLKTQKEYWLHVFSEGIPTLELMTTFKRPHVLTHKGSSYEIPLDAQKINQLKQLAKQKGVTLYSLFLAVYNILLHKISNQEDIVIGTPVAARPHADVEGVVGLFVNTLALRNYPKTTIKFNDFLHQVHETTLGALEHQLYPYEELIDVLDVDRNANRNPLFDVFFNYIHGSNNLTIENQDFKINEYNLPVKTVKFDLTLNAVELDELVKLSFSYSRDLYDQTTIDRFSTYFVRIIDEILLKDTITVSEISILSEEEQNLILNTFNNTLVDISEKTVIDVFKERVKESPESIALLMDDEQLTYKALDKRSDQWASYMISRGVFKGAVVGLYMERSIDVITAMFATMKVGAAYLPIDPKQPLSRTIHMVSESQSTAILTNEKEIPLELKEKHTVISISELNKHQQTINVNNYPVPDDIAYIMYTSGSTGNSKGCIISHKSLFNYISWCNTYYFNDLAQGNFGLMTSMIFDLSVTAIFTSLTRGKKLYMGNEQKGIVQLLEEVFNNPDIDTLKLTPTHINILKDLDIKHTNIRTVICGGEDLKKKHIQILKDINKKIKIYNEYGPTEVTVGCSVSEVILLDFQGNTVLDVFKERVVESPKSIALIMDKEQLTYEALDKRSDQWASCLVSKGVSKGAIVGLYMERSTDVITGILSAMKIGAAYLPIDTQQPLSRTIHMVSESESTLLLSNVELPLELEQKYTTIDVTDLDKHPKNIEEYTYPLPEDTAYIMYTSGSTGNPKGVCNTHAGLINRLVWMRDLMGISQNSTLIQKTPYTFDVSVWELLMITITGSKLVIAKPEGHKDPIYLQELIAKKNIDLIHFVPSMLKEFLEVVSPKECENLQQIVCSGEALTPQIIEKCKLLLPWVQLYNFYGPTEATIDVTAIDLTNVDTNTSEISIGTPVANTQIYIVNRQNQLLPVGVQGELLIGGVQVAKGYLNREDLTAEKFIPNPFMPNDPYKLYKTGDLAKWTKEGEIIFLGRIDDQVKINGVRIELGEIESHLNEINGITDATVLVHKIDGNKHLVAYYIASEKISEESIRNYLFQVLPMSMIPSYYIQMDSFPTTSTGKLARKLLPIPSLKKDSHVAPNTETEKRLIEILAKILTLETAEISTTHNFFQLGGNSLKAMTLINQVRKEFAVKLMLRDIFLYQTIQALSRAIENLEVHIVASIPVAATSKYYPLSSAQKRMYFLYEYNKESLAYNSLKVAKLKGNLDKNRLVSCFQQLVTHHESLRTIFLLKEGNPVQQILETVDFKIDDLGIVPDVHTAISNFMVPFNLSEASLVRVGLIKISVDEHLLLIDNHHIISDGVTNALLFKDFMSIYKGETLPKLPIQYKDYAVWQQSTEQQTSLAEEKEFWLHVYSDEIPTLDLPTDYPRLKVNTNAGATFDFQLDINTTNKLVSLAKSEQTTLFVVLYSIFTILLSKLGGEEDVIVGTSVAGRHHADLENIVGIFINTLALRSKPKSETNYLAYLQKLKEEIYAAFENQKYPYEDLIDDLKLQRDTSRPPLFNVMFEYFNFEKPTVVIPNLELIPYEYDVNITRFDLTLRVLEETDNITLSFQYATELFNESTIQDFSSYFQNLATEVVSNTNIALKNINILSSLDKEFLLNAANSSELSYDYHKSLPTIFSEQATLYPNRIAVNYEGDSLSYEELDKRSNQLANYLRSQKITQGDLVGLLLNRSLDMIVAILGVLKSGAGYVPIDPSLPAQRINYMLAQSKTSLLVSELEYMEQFSTNIPVVYIGETTIWETDSEAFDVEVTMKDVAYCIFTSGSSGKPKGVVMSHGSVFNLVKGLEHTVYKNYEGILRVSLLASYAFDASVQQIFGSLLLGHSLYIIDDESKKDGNALFNFYNNHKIAVSDGTPTHLRILLNSLVGGETLSYLKGWILAGEYLDKSLVTQFYNVFPVAINIYNFYGPTETCVDSTYFKINPEELSKYATIPIGKPLPNERVYITDPYGNLVPKGVMGELCIAGAGLAECYIGNEEMTAERFPSNWIANENRVYRTGDLVKWLPDGNLEYCGRLDDQVKLRGYRIELTEIEHNLNTIPEIEQSVVLLRTREDEKFLVAYYQSEEELEVELLRETLSKRLPDYMLPSYYTHMKKLPLNISGKIAKKELPEFSISIDEQYIAPTSELEILMTTIWQDVLGIEKIGIHDNFFQLGGDSIKTIQIANKSKKAGIVFQIKDLIDAQTIAGLIENLKIDKVEILTEKGILTGKVPLHPIQKQFFDKQHHEVHQFNQAILFNISKTLSKENLTSAVKKLIEIHDSLRLTYEKPANGNYPTQAYGSIEAQLIEEKVDKLDDITALCDTYQSDLNIYEGDLVRFVCIKTPKEEKEDRFLIVVHHLAIDGVSWRILLENLVLLLNTDTANTQASIINKGTSYRQWVNKLTEFSAALEKEEYLYWKNTLSNYQEFPTDFIYDAKVTFEEINSYHLSLSESLTNELIYNVPTVFGTEINDILISGLALSLKDVIKTSKLIIALEGHGREGLFKNIDINSTVGWFTSVYPVCLNLEETDNLSFLISDVKDTLKAIPNKGLGYGVLRHLSSSQEVQEVLAVNYEDIIFNYLGNVSNTFSGNHTNISIANESTGKSASDKNYFGHKISFSLLIKDGSLQLNCKYDSKRFSAVTIEKFANTYITSLEAIVQHCKDISTESNTVDNDQNYDVSFL